MTSAAKSMKREKRSRARSAAPRPRPSFPAGLKPPRWSGSNRYSLFVGYMKVLLPAMAAALILLIVVWPQFQADDSPFRVSVSDLSPGQADSLSMLNARFDGVDEKNQPFSVTADEATQVTDQEDVVELAFPKADITLDDGAWLATEARRGEYLRDQRLLDLRGNVTLFHDKGFELHTESAQIDLRAGTAQGFDTVEGQGPFGTLKAQGFRVQDSGEVIHFIGKSKMTLYPEAEDTL